MQKKVFIQGLILAAVLIVPLLLNYMGQPFYTLDNDKTINSSFSSRICDTFIVSENGNAHMNFGNYKPSSRSGTGV